MQVFEQATLTLSLSSHASLSSMRIAEAIERIQATVLVAISETMQKISSENVSALSEVIQLAAKNPEFKNVLSYSEGRYTIGDTAMTKEQIRRKLEQEVADLSEKKADVKQTDEKREPSKKRYEILSLAISIISIVCMLFPNQLAKLGDTLEEVLPKVVQAVIQFFITQQRIGYIKTSKAALRKEADLASEIIAIIPDAKVVSILDQKEQWVQVVYTDNDGEQHTGWTLEQNVDEQLESFRADKN